MKSYKVKYSDQAQEEEYSPNPSVINEKGKTQGETIKGPTVEKFKAKMGAIATLETRTNEEYFMLTVDKEQHMSRLSLREFILWLIEMEKKY